MDHIVRDVAIRRCDSKLFIGQKLYEKFLLIWISRYDTGSHINIHDLHHVINKLLLLLSSTKCKIDGILAGRHFPIKERITVVEQIGKFIDRRGKSTCTSQMSIRRRKMVHTLCDLFGFSHKSFSNNSRLNLDSSICRGCSGDGYIGTESDSDSDGYIYSRRSSGRCPKCDGSGKSREPLYSKIEIFTDKKGYFSVLDGVTSY